MNTPNSPKRAEAITAICALIKADKTPANAERMNSFAEHFLSRLPLQDLLDREPQHWATLVEKCYEGVAKRLKGETTTILLDEVTQHNEYTKGHSAILIVTNDMPFLVDSATMAINESDLGIHLIAHPVFNVVRDQGGYLLNLAPASEELEDSCSESVMYFEFDKVTDTRKLAQVQEQILHYLSDVNASVEDWRDMLSKVDDACSHLQQAKTPYDSADVEETVEFLRWMADDFFTFLGYREYAVVPRKEEEVLEVRPDTGLGILRDPERRGSSRSVTVLRSHEPSGIAESGPIIVTKTNTGATVHRSGYMDYVGVMEFNEVGELVAERRFLGLFTSAAYNRRPWNIPFVRRKVEYVMGESGYSHNSHGGKALLHIMETLPRDELLQATRSELFDLVMGIFGLQERQQTRLFIRADRFGRFFSCLVYIPRERFNTENRQRIQAVLKRALKGERVDFTVQVSESKLARVHVLIRVPAGHQVEYDVQEIENRLEDAVRTWNDRLREILVDKFGEETGLEWSREYGLAFPAAYQEDVTPWVSAFDVANIASLSQAEDMRLSLYRPRNREAGFYRFKIFRVGSTIPLSDVLPMLENMGLRIVSERPYQLTLSDGQHRWIQDFDMQLGQGLELDLERVREPFQNAFEQIATGALENDGFNRLVLGAYLDWPQVALLRSVCKYLIQTGIPFSQNYMERTLAAHPAVARLLVELFEARFDPARADETQAQAESRVKHLIGTLAHLAELETDQLDVLSSAKAQDRKEQVKSVRTVLRMLVESVRSLDEDRILRAFIGVIRAMLRTSFYQVTDAGQPRPYISFKLNSDKVPELPKPRPWREIFVYSPRVEGIHLRGGPVARGGLRWSDRLEDFRTEVLGLMKAQMVKNTMIVPVGAKGGFVVKQMPDTADREVVMAEVVACYRFFINGLLDITDNLHEDDVVHPDNVVRKDADDPYLVVAADKGTATFSDIANSVSEAHDFWLGDAFASGGSVGYDHKKMGITAKGAWESVKRHFREMGVNCQTEDFTVVGIGDMSGDVFGNGMLLSRHIRLRAAFNHMHIFLDPNPDAATSYAERERLFNLPRSSWTDYDESLISAGGGVFSRKEKTIPLSPEVRKWLGIEEKSMDPQELIRALLKAPADLLWNGGIGTYVKGSAETDAEVGDRANDAVRVDGDDLRCKVVGEGGNLGLTQLGRIEFALNGGRINTDFIDNSAGVDCSDHEVNIKILLNVAMREGKLDQERRNALLAQMTDEVSDLVLRNNYLQSHAISLMQALTVSRLGSKAHFIDVLESEGHIDRELEHLPNHEELQERRAKRIGLTRPELAVLLSYSKITLYQELLSSEVPEDPYLSAELSRYFPEPLRENYGEEMLKHRLKREIIATAVTNSMVNRMGATFTLRMHEDTGAAPSAIAKAYTAAREVFNARRWWEAVESYDNKIDTQRQIEMELLVWNLLRHVTRWILTRNRDRLNIADLVERYSSGVQTLLGIMREIGDITQSKHIAELEGLMQGAGVDAGLAKELAIIPVLPPALDLIEVAYSSQDDLETVARIYFELDRELSLTWLMDAIEKLKVDGQWHAHARGGLRDELFRQHRRLTAAVVTDSGDADARTRVNNWANRHRRDLDYYVNMMTDMRSRGAMDYATVSVAVRGLEQLVASIGESE